jgi:hypothetical protein
MEVCRLNFFEFLSFYDRPLSSRTMKKNGVKHQEQSSGLSHTVSFEPLSNVEAHGSTPKVSNEYVLVCLKDG